MGKSMPMLPPPYIEAVQTVEKAPVVQVTFGPREGYGFSIEKKQVHAYSTYSNQPSAVYRGSSDDGYGFGTGFMFGLMF